MFNECDYVGESYLISKTLFAIKIPIYSCGIEASCYSMHGR